MSTTQLNIPLPLHIIIDDVGWWCGRDGSNENQPYRTGIARDHVPADYRAIARLGKGLAMRPQCAMILGEWDVNDSLRTLPSAQWMGEAWHNPWPRGPMEEAADILRRESDHIEIALHGIAHEYWPEDRKVRRAEWFDRETKTHRPIEHVRGVLEAFARIHDLHNLGPQPTAFVPCASEYAFDSHLADELRSAGILYHSCTFNTMANGDAAQDSFFGIDRGLIMVERGLTAPRWYDIATDPNTLEGYNPDHSIIGLHWPNILHLDPARNDEVVDRWVNYLKPVGQRIDRVLARDTADGYSQLLYHRKASVTRASENQWTITFADVDTLGAIALRDELTVKIAAPQDTTITADGATISESTYNAEDNYHTARIRRGEGDLIVSCVPKS